MMKKAVALGYNDKEDPAPKILAKGSGPTAEAIMAIADQEGIACIKHKPLADSLYDLEISEYIPEEWYSLVADLLLFVYRDMR